MKKEKWPKSMRLKYGAHAACFGVEGKSTGLNGFTRIIVSAGDAFDKKYGYFLNMIKGLNVLQVRCFGFW